MDWPLVASALGFMGTVMLFYPGWRVSQTMKLVSSLRALSRRSASAGEGRQAERQESDGNVDGLKVAWIVAQLLEQHATDWRPLEHGLLVGGILSISLSFAVDLFLVKLD